MVSVYESFFASLLRLVGAMGVHVASFLACCISRVPNVCFCKVLDILLIGLGSRIQSTQSMQVNVALLSPKDGEEGSRSEDSYENRTRDWG